jgi:hypothetical protein
VSSFVTAPGAVDFAAVPAGLAGVFFGGVVGFVPGSPGAFGFPLAASAACAVPASMIAWTRARIEADACRFSLEEGSDDKVVMFNLRFPEKFQSG